MPKVKEIVAKINSVTRNAPLEVREAALDFINAMSDFDPNSETSITEANRVWNQDLPQKYRGKFNLS